MLPLVIAVIIFFFLVVGAIVFFVCILIAPLRRYALSTALWCAMWGPCSVAFLLLAGTAVVAEAFVTRNGDVLTLHAPKLLAALGWGYLALSILGTTVIATLVAWLHQFLLHRITFALFRLYATVVCAGIGSVFGWCLGWLLAWREVHYLLLFWLIGMMILIVGFGRVAYRTARSLRGKPAAKFTWVTTREFNGA